jgi:hypothetical protein
MSLLMSMSATAQEDRSSSSIYLHPAQKADVTIPFAVNGEGHRFEPTWGLDLAWINEQNMRKGVRHMGKENVGIARSAFRATNALTNDSVLGSDQLNYLQRRSNLLTNVVGATLPVVLTADQEAGADEYFVKNKNCDVEHWAAMINSHVHWMQKYTKHPVVGVSPYNEPDYWSVEEGATVQKQKQVAQLLKEQYPRMADVAIVGGNTLNNDKALTWYTSGKAYYDWGNTHQLAGSFDTFAAFYQQLQKDGKVGYGDEMHNVGEAMIGLEYGMTVGIWWGFDSRARGEFCDISRHGERLAYGEHRNNWTAASVYRHDDGRVKAFIGSSERQAATTNYQFLSRDREVYYDTQGPSRDFFMQIPGGTAYQQGQSNAERVIDVLWGEDVPRAAITEGTYRIVNRATGTMLAVVGDSIYMQKSGTGKSQQWTVTPVVPGETTSGDFSFYELESVSKTNLHINVINFNTADGAGLLAYNKNTNPDSNEQWYLQYAGDGYFYIRNRETSLLLTTASSLSISNVKVHTNVMMDKADENAGRQMWRLLPVGVNYETTAPARPAGLVATAQTASVKLSWTANSENDVTGYMVLRADKESGEWNTIARNVKSCNYVDNTCQPAHAYIYKVKALDRAENLSEASETVEATPTGKPALVAHWTMDSTLLDKTENLMDVAVYGKESYVNGRQEGTQALALSVGSYAQLPYEVAGSDELTFCAWVYCRSTSSWQRIFDFGNGTDQYLFLTPNNGSVMRFAIKNGGDEQEVKCPSKLPTAKWKHVAVTLGSGKEVASNTGITIRPSDIRPVLNYLGRSQFPADPNFNGYFSDVRIYNHALNAEEVQRVMNGIEDEGVKGDVNGDGSVNAADIFSIINHASTNVPDDKADVNADGTVDVGDIITVISIMSE